jgi:hypothetical protein
MAVLPSKKKSTPSKSRKTKDENSPSAKWTAIKAELSKNQIHWRSINATSEPIESHSSPQLQALKEALDCPGCDYANNVSKSMLLIDETVLKTYDTLSYPYHFINQVTTDTTLCPLSTEPAIEENPTFWEEIPDPLRKRYYKQLEVIINRYNTEGARLTEYEVGHLDKDEVFCLAHYQLDYHIQQHYLRNRSWVSLCRDEDDLLKLQSYQWKMAALGGDWKERMKPNGVNWREGWANDYNRGFEQQIEFWGKQEPQREKQVAMTRERWAYIQKLRGMQRLQKIDADANIQTFRFYLGPRLLRTINVTKETPETRDEAEREAERYIDMWRQCLDNETESDY